MNYSWILQDRTVPEIIGWVMRRSIGLATGKQRLLPDFIIIGAQRSGTTSLFNYLCQHPQIHGSFPKEVHYFSNFFLKGITWYRSHFPLALWKRIPTRGAERKFISGEATPYYLAHPQAPKRASEVVPGARLIVLLRNPVDRAYSHYQHEVRMGVESLTFEEALYREDERLHMELEKLGSNEDYRSFNFQHYSYRSRGIYIDQIQAWRSYFPLETMLILTSEGLEDEPTHTMSKVLDFLELGDWQIKEFKKYHHSAYLRLDSRIRDDLSRYYQPHNQRLYDYMGANLGWE